jgi:hypothetical protein
VAALAMEGSVLFPSKTDAQVEAELAQAERAIQMLSAATGGAGGSAAHAAVHVAEVEDCALTWSPSLSSLDRDVVARVHAS